MTEDEKIRQQKLNKMQKEYDEEKRSGGQVYPSEQGHIPNGTWNQTYEAGITRRNKLIDDLVVGMVATVIDSVDADKDTAADVQVAFDETIKMACRLADKTIAESNK